MNKTFYALLIFTIIISSVLRAQTYVTGGIYANTTWTTANSPYIVQDSLTLFPNDTLTIQPGVEVKFEDGVWFDVRGRLIANGTITDSIIFTSASLNPTSMSWQSIIVHDELVGSIDFRYCRISYGYNALEIYPPYGMGTYSTVTHCLFSNNWFATECNASDYIHLKVDSSAYISNNVGVHECRAPNVITNTLFQNNTYALYHDNQTLVSNCTFCGNFRAVEISSSYLTNCLLVNNNIAISAFWDSQSQTLTNCIIADNDTGLILRSGSSNYDVYNNVKVCNNHVYNVVHAGVYNYDLSNICFCTTDSTTIAASIYDGYDNANFGLVDFTPITTCSIDILPTCSSYLGIASNNLRSIKHSYSFPNPFTMSTTIQFNLSHSSKISLKVFEMNGTLVQTLIDDEMLPSGAHETDFLAANNVSGFYFYILKTDEKTEEGKMILMK